MPKCRDNKPWERQPKESTQAFEAFKLYLEMGTDRSYAKVGQQLSKSKTLIDRWGRDWNWQERIREYDNFVQAEADKAVKREVKSRYERFGKASDHLLHKALQVVEGVKIAQLTPQDALAFIRVAVTLADKHKVALLPQEVNDGENEDLLGALLLAFEEEDIEHDK